MLQTLCLVHNMHKKTNFVSEQVNLSFNLFILHRLRNKFLELITLLISLDSASWELHPYSRRLCGPMEIRKLTAAPGNRTQDLLIVSPTLLLTTTDTK